MIELIVKTIKKISTIVSFLVSVSVLCACTNFAHADKQNVSFSYKVLDQHKGESLDKVLKSSDLTNIQQRLVADMPASKSARTDRKIYMLFENSYLRAIRVVRGESTAEYALVKYHGQWTWVDEKGQIRSSGGFFARYPLRFLRVSSRFNPRRRHPVSGRVRPHTGMDLKARYGTPIYAPSGGVVKFSGRQRGYGITLEIDHKNGYVTKYAHLSRIIKGATKGRYVKRGQLIAKVGSSGVATGPHLHYEVIVNGVKRNPATVRLPGPPKGAASTKEAQEAADHYLPILRKLSQS